MNTYGGLWYPPPPEQRPNKNQQRRQKKSKKKQKQKRLQNQLNQVNMSAIANRPDAIQQLAVMHAQTSPQKWFKKNVRPDYTALIFGLSKPNWNEIRLNPFQKNFFQPTQAYLQRSPREIEAYRIANEITVSDRNAPPPITSFSEVNLPEDVVNKFQQNGIVAPTAIQAQGLPIAMKGIDLVGIAKTGSGKTLAYLLPAGIHVANQSPLQPGDGPIVLVMAPTRELAQQITQVSKEYFQNLRSACIYGGASKAGQAEALKAGVEIVIGTPGRILDFMSEKTLSFGRTTFVVLDEADRMLDLGFEPQIRNVLNYVRPDRQMCMWSATWPTEIQRLAQDYLSSFIQVNIGAQQLSANHSITQHVQVVREEEKNDKLLQLLNRIGTGVDNKTIIFCNSKGRVNRLAKFLTAKGILCAGIHGRKVQRARDEILDDFRTGKVPTLVATDVAGRGLDVDDIKVVINYDFMQNSPADYVHRIGRTGRCGRMGTAYTFFTKKSAGHACFLIRILEEANQNVCNELRYFAASKQKS